MRILYHHRTRATDAQKIHILEMIAAFREIGHEVTIASLVETEKRSSDPEREARDSPLRSVVRHFPLASELVQLGYNLFAVPWLTYKIHRSGAELIYERYSLLNFSGVLAAALTGKPIVLEVNSPLALEMAAGKEIRAHRFASWMERTICNHATRVVVVSGPLRRILTRSGVAESKLRVLPNGVNLRRIRTSPSAQLRKSLGIGDRTVIGFVGWFRPWHGLELLLEAFSKSGVSDGRAVLLLVGDGPAMPGLKEYVNRHGLGQAVIFAGPVPHEEIPSYLELVDIAVQPAANEYCSPMKILEYMALEKAILAPRQENIEELLEEGRTAVLFKPDDPESLSEALVRLCADSKLRSALGKNALTAIGERGLLWEANATKIVEMIQTGTCPRKA